MNHVARAAWACLAALVVCVGYLRAAPLVSLECGQAETIHIDRDAAVVVGLSAPGELRVLEQGHLLLINKAPAMVGQAYMATPYRFGEHRVQLEAPAQLGLRRSSPDGPSAVAAHVEFTCPAQARADHAWFSEVSALSGRLRSPPPPTQLQQLLDLTNALEAQGASARDRASVAHLRAQLFLMSERTTEAAEAFETAARRWDELAEHQLSAVANAGLMEQLFKLGRHADALALARTVPLARASSEYFAARLRNAECLALRYAGDLSGASQCFDASIARLRQLGETLELVSAMQDHADVLRFLGQHQSADRLAKAALVASRLPGMEWQRGRLHLTLGAIAQDTGNLEVALVHFDEALTEFDHGQSRRWQANALLVASELYMELGALEEALDFINGATDLLTETDAPARIAAARVQTAKVQMARGQFDLAMNELARADAVYKTLSMPMERDLVAALQSRLALEIGDTEAASKMLASRDSTQTASADAWHLVAAEIAERRGNCSEAASALAQIRSLGIDDSVNAALVKARCLAKEDHRAAEALLVARAEWLRRISSRTGSPLLAKLLMRRTRVLRDLALDLSSGQPGGPSALHTWKWMQRSATPMTSRRTGGAREFDKAVAQALLSRDAVPARSAAASRALIESLTRGEVSRDADARGSLADLQARLSRGQVYLTLAKSGTQSIMLLVTNDKVDILPGPAVPRVRSASLALTALLQSTTNSVAVIETHAKAIAALVLPRPLEELEASHLLVDADSELAIVPWNALSWPGSGRPLVESSAVTLARLTTLAREPRSTQPSVVVYTAPQAVNTAGGRLWTAEAEASLIDRALKVHGATVSTLAANDRSGLVGAFAQPRRWLHIASHGESHPTRLGYSGIWMGGGQKPRFVSWLSALASGGRSELVVLNACSLGASADQAFGTGFAEALLESGTQDIVAARWKVSDSAARIWVPRFYEHVVREGPAEALRKAQVSIRAERLYRHPFYWATYSHFGQL